MSNLMLNLDDYVRVTQTAQDEVIGRYDGVDYVFPHGEPVDVHKAVAVHIFGFGLPEQSDDPRVQDKTPALLRLGWINSSGEKKSALAALRTSVRFEEIPPFPNILRLRQPEENTGILDSEPPSSATESASRVPSSPPLGSGAGQAAAGPSDPQKRTTLGLPKASKQA